MHVIKKFAFLGFPTSRVICMGVFTLPCLCSCPRFPLPICHTHTSLASALGTCSCREGQPGRAELHCKGSHTLIAQPHLSSELSFSRGLTQELLSRCTPRSGHNFQSLNTEKGSPRIVQSPARRCTEPPKRGTLQTRRDRKSVV